MTEKNKSELRGFARMTPEERRAAASKGGKKAHALGRAYRWDSAKAMVAGRKGGRAKRGVDNSV